MTNQTTKQPAVDTDAKIESVRKTLKLNLNKLVKAKNLKQEDMLSILGVTGKATISNYLSIDGDPEKAYSQSVPSVMSLYLLKEKYGISIDTLLSPSFNPEFSYELDGVNIAHHNKFLGVYIIYYISSNKISNRLSHYNSPVISYGVLAIAKDNNCVVSVASEIYKAFACFSIKTEEEAVALKKKAEAAFQSNDLNTIRNVFVERKRYCEGTFDLVFQGNFFNINLNGLAKQESNDTQIVIDKISMLGFNPPNSDINKPYIGGVIHNSSISRGPNHCPCSQFLIASRQELQEGYEQELIAHLREKHKAFNTKKVVTEVIERFRSLHENKHYELPEKEILLKEYLSTAIETELDNNSSQLFYILREEEQEAYQFLKHNQKDAKSDEN